MTPKSGAEIRYFSKSEITSEEQRVRGGGRGERRDKRITEQFDEAPEKYN